jgi:TetR/AcrR family fatty acid metabolism transcriptional regulator
MIRATVRAGQHAGIFRQDISEKIAANCFFGALDEMVTSWVLSDRDYPLAGAAEIIVKVILRGMESRAVGDEDSKDR